MFRPMRRSAQALPHALCEEILQQTTAGVLAVVGDDGYPYAVPLSHLYSQGKLYFHCAKTGHKLDALLQNPKVSYCVIRQDEVVLEEYTTYYCSVVAFGRARVIEDPQQKRHALTLIAQRFGPDDPAGCAAEVEKSLVGVCMVEVEVEHLSGKESKELADQRRKTAQ